MSIGSSWSSFVISVRAPKRLRIFYFLKIQKFWEEVTLNFFPGATRSDCWPWSDHFWLKDEAIVYRSWLIQHQPLLIGSSFKSQRAMRPFISGRICHRLSHAGNTSFRSNSLHWTRIALEWEAARELLVLLAWVRKLILRTVDTRQCQSCHPQPLSGSTT